MRTDRYNSNNREYTREEANEAERHVRALLGLSSEMVRWFDRIDDAVDEIAEMLDLHPISYGADTEYCKKNDIGYNSAYRVELLKNAIEISL